MPAPFVVLLPTPGTRRSASGDRAAMAIIASSGSGTLQEPQIERPEHQDDSDVHHQPLPEPVSEEQNVHADHDGYQREHAEHDGSLSSHPSFLLRATRGRRRRQGRKETWPSSTA